MTLAVGASTTLSLNEPVARINIDRKGVLEASLKELDAANNPLAIWRPQAQLLLAVCPNGGARTADEKRRAAAARAQLHSMPGISFDVYPTAKRLLETP